MSFKTIFKKNYRKDEKLFLLKRSIGAQEDELGFAKEGYEEVKRIDGIIQNPQEQDINFKGEESEPKYIGYFLPTFLLQTDEIADYRIRYERPHETQIFKIQNYDPNLFLKGRRDHIQMELILDKKYKG